MKTFSSVFLVAAVVFFPLPSIVNAESVLFLDDFEANTAVTMPSQAAVPAHPGSPGTDMNWTIAYDTPGTNAQVWNNLDPSNPAEDAGSNKYLALNHNMGTADAVAWAHGWDPELTLNKQVELNFDLWVQSSLTPEDRYLAFATYDGPEGTWWVSGRAWGLQFRSDGSIFWLPGSTTFSDTGLTFTTDAWQHVTLAADLEARTYSLTVEGSTVNDLSWSPATYKIQALYLQSCIGMGTSAVDNFSFTIVPEPSVFVLLITGLFGFLICMCHKRK